MQTKESLNRLKLLADEWRDVLNEELLGQVSKLERELLDALPGSDESPCTDSGLLGDGGSELLPGLERRLQTLCQELEHEANHFQMFKNKSISFLCPTQSEGQVARQAVLEKNNSSSTTTTSSSTCVFLYTSSDAPKGHETECMEFVEMAKACPVGVARFIVVNLGRVKR